MQYVVSMVPRPFRDNQSVVKVMNKKESEETAFWIFWCTQSSHKRNIKTLLSTRRGQVFCQNLSVPSRQQEIQMAAASAANVVSWTWLGGGDACSYSTWDLATEITGLLTHRHTHVSMHTHTHFPILWSWSFLQLEHSMSYWQTGWVTDNRSLFVHGFRCWKNHSNDGCGRQK